MDHRPPSPAASAEPARWLTDRVDLCGPDWVTNLVGWNWPTYARLFHPLADQPGFSTWAATAQANGRIMHPSAQWDTISTPPSQATKSPSAGRSQPGDPMWGKLNAWALEALCAILARHTVTPRACYFALWEGCCGWRHGDVAGSTVTSFYAPDGVPLVPPEPAPVEWQLDFNGPTFAIHDLGRGNYYLFEGHIGDCARIGRWVHEKAFFPQSPNFIWSADHAWCVATDIDDDSTFIGGSAALIEELCASNVLEVLPIAPDAPYEDHRNR
jgi:hypothetical protein